MATKISAKAKSHPDVGLRAKSAAHTDAFMRGDRYGTVVGVVSRKVGGVNQTRYLVESDRTGKIRRVAKSAIELDERVRNPATACAPVRRPSHKSGGYNVHVGDVFMHHGARLKVIGCGMGAVAHKSAGAQTEGTYAVQNTKTEKVRYLAKRVVRDAIYNKGTEGRPAPKGPRTAKRRSNLRAKTGRNRKGQFVRKGR